MFFFGSTLNLSGFNSFSYTARGTNVRTTLSVREVEKGLSSDLSLLSFSVVHELAKMSNHGQSRQSCSLKNSKKNLKEYM